MFDADSPPALAFIRSLGRAGVEVHVHSASRLPAARCSRWASRFASCPPLEDLRAFGDWLRDAVEAERIRLVAPTSDLVAFHLAQLGDRAPEAMRRGLAPAAAVRDTVMKDRFAAACGRTGIRTPATRAPRSLREALEEARGLRFPLILKPRSHVGVGLARGLVVMDEAELCERFSAYPLGPGSELVGAEYPDLGWPLLQEYVPGALRELYSVAGFLDAAGRTLAIAASRKLSQWPPLLGIGTVFEACRDPELLERGVKVARRLLGRGLFELEFIRDPGGEFLLIDVNPRAYGQMSFEIARGLDLPLLWYRTSLGEEQVPAATPTRGDLIWLHSVPYHIGQLVRIARGPKRREWAREYRRLLERPRVDSGADSQDPWASALYVLRNLRHPVGMMRAFLTAPPALDCPEEQADNRLPCGD